MVNVNYTDMSIEDLKQLTTKKKREAALALYLKNIDLSIRKVAELLDIREGTALRWSQEDEWNTRREEDKEKRIELLRLKINKEGAAGLYEVFYNHLQRSIQSSQSEVPIVDTSDQKRNIEIVEKTVKMLELLLKLEGASQKVEIEGTMEYNNSESEYEKKLYKFSEMLDTLPSPNKEVEEDGE